MYNKILIPLDGSKTAEKVLPYARYLAGKFTIPVELLAVIDIAEMAAHMAAEKARFLDRMIEDGERNSKLYLRLIADTFPGVNVTCTVDRARAEEAIIEKAAADKGTLITMATHGRSGLNRFLLGSVAEKVLRGSANPLLLVRAEDEGAPAAEVSFKRIIVPLDGSLLAEGVLSNVADMANKLDLEVELFRAYHIPHNVYGDDWGLSGSYEELVGSVRDEATEYLRKKSEQLKGLGVAKTSYTTKEGFAGDEIIALGRHTADNLIAMSSHGRSGMKRWVLGSVAETVVRHTSDPVLVLRAR